MAAERRKPSGIVTSIHHVTGWLAPFRFDVAIDHLRQAISELRNGRNPQCLALPFA